MGDSRALTWLWRRTAAWTTWLRRHPAALLGILALTLIAGSPTPSGTAPNVTAEHRSVAVPGHACRLWGAVGSPPDSLVTDQLVTGTYSFRALGASNRDGWGLAFHPPVLHALGWDRPVIERGGPRADHAHDARFGEAVARMLILDPSCALAHIRAASSGHTAVPDPHPFCRTGVTFAHNGTISRTTLASFLRQGDPDYLQTHPPDYWDPYIDSELYMLYILKLREQGVDHGGRTLSHSLQDAAIEAVLRIYDAGAIVTAGNFLVISGDTLFAMNFDPDDTEHYTLHYKEVPGGWIVCSEPVGSDTTGWAAMPPKSLGIFTATAPPFVLTVYPPDGPFLALRERVVDDDLEDESAGNDDQGCDAGETIELRIALCNLGSQTASNVRATLSTEDPYCEITDEYEEYGDIPSGEELFCLEDFDLEIDPACPDKHDIDLTLAVACDGRASWDLRFSLRAEAPIIELAGYAVSDTLGGDGDGRIEPGETILLSTTLANTGSEDATGLQILLWIAHPQVTIIQGEASLDSFFAGSDTLLLPAFEFHVADSCPEPELLFAELFVTGDWEQSANMEFQLPVGGFFDDFEADTGAWVSYVVTDSGGFVDQWHRSTTRNFTPGGEWSWKLGDTADSTYASLVDGALESPALLLRPTSYLCFRHWMEAEVSGTEGQCYDGGLVEMSIDSSAWVQIFPVGGYSHTIRQSGSGSGPWPEGTEVFSGAIDWEEVVFEINDVEGQARFRFRFGSDGAIAREGWYVDDVEYFGHGDPPAGIDETTPAVRCLTLEPNRPNPFGPSTAIICRMPQRDNAVLRIFDAGGRLVRTLVNGQLEPGTHVLTWDGRDETGVPVSSGVYFCRLKAGTISQTRKMILAR